MSERSRIDVAGSIRWLPVVHFKLRDDVPPPALPLPIDPLIGSASLRAGIPTGLLASWLFAHTTLAELTVLAERARRLSPGYEPPQFRNFLSVRTPDVGVAHLLADRLRQVAQVEHARVVGIAPLPGPVDPSNDPRSPDQTHLGPPLLGVNAQEAWKLEADGSGVRMTDIERGFHDHEDLPAITLLFGIQSAAVSERAHGTAVLGVVGARDNDRGGIGIAPNVTLQFVSRLGATNSPVSDSEWTDLLVEAIAQAGLHSEPGDVVLIEDQDWFVDTNGDHQYIPVEADTLVADIIETLVKGKVVVIEPAGNSAFDVTPNCPANLETIIVGGVDSVSGNRSNESNYGALVDLCGVADGIVSSGGELPVDAAPTPEGPNPGDPKFYTKVFGRTSGAAAIVAGAACLVQSHVAMKYGYRLGPRPLRDLLFFTGEKTKDPSSDLVGTMPDVKRAIEGIALANAVEFEFQNKPSGLPDPVPLPYMGDTPDMRMLPYPSPPGEDPFAVRVEGADFSNGAFIYLRARNRGTQPLVHVHAHVYACRPSLLAGPNAWVFVGRIPIGPVPNDGTHHSLNVPLAWGAELAQAAGGCTLLAVLGTRRLPPPDLETIRNSTEAGRFLTQCRFVGSRARAWGAPFALEDGALARRFEFRMDGVMTDESEQIEVYHSMSGHVRVRMPVPDGFTPGTGVVVGSDQVAELPYGTSRFKFELAPGAVTNCRVNVGWPAGAPAPTGDIVVKRMVRDVVVAVMRARVDAVV